MTAEELERTIAKREMSRLELKESFGAECIETACAFANAAGGYVVIGVDDHCVPSKNQLRIEGLRDYETRISTATEPSVAVDAEKVPFKGHEVVVLRVQENPSTYQIRDKKVEALAKVENQHQSSVESERVGEISGVALRVALRVALKTALKTALKDDDEIVAKILAVYKGIANNTTISLSAVAEKVGLSARTVDEYVGIMKSAKVLRRKGGRKFGEWEILMIDNLGGSHV